jgi:hypothetical protein
MSNESAAAVEKALAEFQRRYAQHKEKLTAMG